MNTNIVTIVAHCSQIYLKLQCSSLLFSEEPSKVTLLVGTYTTTIIYIKRKPVLLDNLLNNFT